MIKFYVYHIKSADPKDRLHVFVSDILEFARNGFDPNIMEFTGVSIEAESHQSAADAYANPQSNNVMCSCDEPMVTKIQREFYSKDLADIKQKQEFVEQELMKASIALLLEKIEFDVISLNHKLSALSRCLYGLNQNQSFEAYYDQLKRNYADKLLESKYRPYDSPDERPTGN